MGREWADLALTGQVLGPDEPRARPVRPAGIRAHIASLPGDSRPLFVTSCPQRRPWLRGEGRWAPERGIEPGVGPGAAMQEPLPPHWRRTSHKTRTHSGRNRAVAAGRVSDGAGLSVTLRGSFADFFSKRRWTTPTFAFSFILKLNTDPVTRWVEAMEEYFFLPAALSRGV